MIFSTRWAVITRKCHYSNWRSDVFCPWRRVVSSDFQWRWYYHNIISKKYGLESDSCTTRPRRRVTVHGDAQRMDAWSCRRECSRLLTSDGIDTEQGRTGVEELRRRLRMQKTQHVGVVDAYFDPDASPPRLKLPPKGILKSDRLIDDMKSISKQSYHQILVFLSNTL